MILIRELCEALEGSDYYLYIKPKPNAPRGDYDEFNIYNNVLVGIYSEDSSGSDILNQGYNIFRYLLLQKAYVVINAGTTFGLEAALVGKRIIQLRLREGDYKGFAKWCRTYHLQNYVLSLDGVFDYNNKKSQLLDEIENGDMSFSKQMKSWVDFW